MKGVITGRDVIVNAVAIVRLWGAAAWLACAWAAITRRPTTFLAVLQPALRPAPRADRAAPPGAIMLATAVTGPRSPALALRAPAARPSRRRAAR